MPPLTFSLTFAGVPFVSDMGRVFRMHFARPEQEAAEGAVPQKYQPLPDLIDEINRMIDMRLLQDMALPLERSRAENSLAHLHPSPDQPAASSKIGEFYYPTGAERWSVFRGLATADMAKAMQDATGGNTPQPFSMQAVPATPNPYADDSYKVETDLYLLPPRPLAQLGGGLAGLYLITLVDARYYWQSTPVSLDFNHTSTWAGLISQIATALGAQIDHSSIDGVYTKPEKDSQLWALQADAPTLLDAIAGNLGRVVVREMNGSYTLLTAAESLERVNLNRQANAQVVRTAGGEIFNSGLPWTMPGRNAVVPATVNVVFPQYITTDDPVPHLVNKRYANQRPSAWFEDGFGGAFVVSVPVQSGVCYSGSLISGVAGVSQQTIWDTAKSLYFTEALLSGAPLNASGLTALSMQIARDVCDWQALAALDEVYPGTVAWTPEGFHDIVWTWSERKAQASTRVMRTEWNQTTPLMQHATPALSGSTNTPRGVGGPSVAQTWQDGQGYASGMIATTLASGLPSGGMVAGLTDPSYFPTQNRWKGRVEQEIILFEGTSGRGDPLGVVQRGIDGTIEKDHPANAPVVQLAANTTYGANLVQIEKMQFAYPGAVRSGGIAGVTMVPQVQSVTVVGNATVLSGRRHYLANVVIMNPPEGMEFQTRENVYLIERNEEPLSIGLTYEGQFIGYSVQPVRPVYLTTARAGFWARIVSQSSAGCLSKYGFQEVNFNGCDVGSGGTLTGDAFESSGNTTILADPICGAIVWIRWDVFSETYRFWHLEELVPVKITAAAGVLYIWQEQQATAGGQWQARPGGRSGVAYELNRRTDVPVDSIVWARQRRLPGCTEWEFQFETPAASTTTIINNYNNVTIINNFYGVDGQLYVVCDNQIDCTGANNCKLYIWACQGDICGWYDVCACQWLPQCFWCVAGACITSREEPEGASGGPYLTENECEEDCGGIPWWCVTQDTTCSDCEPCARTDLPVPPSGVPEQWGFGVFPPAIPAFAELAGTWILNRVGGCFYATGNAGTLPRWTLGWLGPNPNDWVLQWFASNGATGAAEHDSEIGWNCCGGNYLYPTDSNVFPAFAPFYLYPLPLDTTCECNSTEQETQCIQSETEPEGSTGDSFTNEDDCRTGCSTTDPWWCVQTTTSPGSECAVCCNEVAFPDTGGQGSPEEWELTVPIPSVDPGFTDLSGVFTLTRTDGCNWTTASLVPGWTLGLGLDGWQLVGVSAAGVVQFTIPGITDIACCGANTFLPPQSSGTGFPWDATQTLTMTPVGTCECAEGVGDIVFDCQQSPTAPSGAVAMFSNEDDCLAGCGDGAYWCVGGQCVRSSARPQGATGDPFDTELECSQVCEGAPVPFWCLNTGASSGGCVSSATDPGGSTGVPYDTQEECEAACGGVTYYWCLLSTRTCVASATDPGGTTGIGYDNQSACETACADVTYYWCADGVCTPSDTEPPGSDGNRYDTLEECQAQCPSVEVNCCPGVTIPETLCLTVVAPSCPCIDGYTATLLYQGVSGGVHTWRSSADSTECSTGATGLPINLVCDSNTGVWSMFTDSSGCMTVDDEFDVTVDCTQGSFMASTPITLISDSVVSGCCPSSSSGTWVITSC